MQIKRNRVVSRQTTMDARSRQLKALPVTWRFRVVLAGRFAEIATVFRSRSRLGLAVRLAAAAAVAAAYLAQLVLVLR